MITYLDIQSLTFTYNGAYFGLKSTGKILVCNASSSTTVSLPTNWTNVGEYTLSHTFGFLTIPTVNNQVVSLRYNGGNIQLMCSTATAIYVQGSGATMLNG